METPKIASLSYIVPTLNRPEYLRHCLDSISKQTVLPREVVVVDQSDGPETKKVFEEAILEHVQKKYVFQKEKGLTKARNTGIRNVFETDFIGFLDDDLVLEPRFTEYLLRHFQAPGGEKYAAGMGTISGSHYKKNLLRKIFFLSHDGDGRILPSGAPTFPHWMDHFAEVEFVSGGMSIYRAKLLKQFGYDDRMVRYAYGDDVDVAYRLSRKHKLFYEPGAVVHHDTESPGRDPGTVFRKQMVQNMFYLMKKNMGMNLRNRLCFSWFVTGQILDDLVSLRRSAFFGNFLAIANILKGRLDSVDEL